VRPAGKCRADDIHDETSSVFGCKMEPSDSFYHSLLRDHQRDEQNVAHYEGVDRNHNGLDETTHMSWDEVL